METFHGSVRVSSFQVVFLGFRYLLGCCCHEPRRLRRGILVLVFSGYGQKKGLQKRAPEEQSKRRTRTGRSPLAARPGYRRIRACVQD